MESSLPAPSLVFDNRWPIWWQQSFIFFTSCSTASSCCPLKDIRDKLMQNMGRGRGGGEEVHAEQWQMHLKNLC